MPKIYSSPYVHNSKLVHMLASMVFFPLEDNLVKPKETFLNYDLPICDIRRLKGDIFKPVDNPDEVEMLAWGMKWIVEPLKRKDVEIGMDPTYLHNEVSTNFRRR